MTDEPGRNDTVASTNRDVLAPRDRGAEGRVVVISTDVHRRRALAEVLRASTFTTDTIACWADDQIARDVRLFFVDLAADDLDGVDQVHRLVRTKQNVPVVVIGALSDEARIIAAIHSGAHGCISVEDAPEHIARAADEALCGGWPMSRGIALLLVQHVRRTGRRRSSAELRPFRPLTDKECQVLRQMATGQSYEDVGRALGVSLNTVRTYVRSVYEKLDVNSRTEAVVLATELGIVGKRGQPEPPPKKTIRGVVDKVLNRPRDRGDK